MRVEEFVNILGTDFYTGVPDSQLKALCDYLYVIYDIDPNHHIIAANEGNCVGIAAGYHLATGRIPVVYMQNSGEGNMVNPYTSLLSKKIYGIPVIFVIGWRGEPGVKDEPQHAFQGEVTIKLLEDMEIETTIVSKTTTKEELEVVMSDFRKELENGKCVAFVIQKDALCYEQKAEYKNNNVMMREKIIECVVKAAGEMPIISTTGKASRELFEIRERNGQSHKYDFLTVGAMGHASSIAMGIAANKPDTKVWCIDGDSAAIMHMGAMATIGTANLDNMVHIIINNGSHETVGGMPSVATGIDFVAVAKACGYGTAISVSSYGELEQALALAKSYKGLFFIEAKTAIGSRNDLGRPTTTPIENKEEFKKHLRCI